MAVRAISVEPSDGGATLLATVTSDRDDRSTTLEFAFPGTPAPAVSTGGDTFLAALLLPAMVRGEMLHIDAPVSRRLMRSTPGIMAIYRTWCRSSWIERELPHVAVEASVTERQPIGRGVGLFFSCGVDSFYSLCKDTVAHPPGDPDAVSQLILVHGFDVTTSNQTLWGQLETAARQVADATGKSLVLVRTNLREFSDPIIPWAVYHGAAIAAVGLALTPLLRRSVIASTHAYGELVPWGSHPLLDPLWATEAVEFVHDGCEALRTEKIAYLTSSELALANLRVCWSSEATSYNCGRCEKCLRTMIGLAAAGALDRCRTFSEPLTPAAVRRISLSRDDSSIRFVEDLLLALDGRPQHRDLAIALRATLRHTRWRMTTGRFVRQMLGPQATVKVKNALALLSSARPISRKVEIAPTKQGGVLR